MSRGETPSHGGYYEMITQAIISEIDSELRHSGLSDYKFDREKCEVTFRKPHDMHEVDALLRVARTCLLDGASVLIR